MFIGRRIKTGVKLKWYTKLGPHYFGSRPTVCVPRWITHLFILYKVPDTYAALSIHDRQ